MEERFWEKVMKTDTCWLWTAGRDSAGYGIFRTGGRANVSKAHRVAYVLAKGPVPAGLDLDHLCRVRRCVNPDHLEPVTRKENILRGVGIGAINARKIHCLRGHVLPAREGHQRQCLTCDNKRKRESRPSRAKPRIVSI